MITPANIVIINAAFMFATGKEDYVFDEVLTTISASYTVERTVPASHAVYSVMFNANGARVGGIVFIPDGQTIQEACAIYAERMIDISKAKVTLGPHAMN